LCPVNGTEKQGLRKHILRKNKGLCRGDRQK
jgi:hypothetical protein